MRDSLEFGRECDGLLLFDAEVSRRHAVVRRDGDTLTIEDLGSTNGTTLNGQRLDGSQPFGDGDTVRLGGTELRVVQPSNLGDAPAEPGTAHATMVVGDSGSTGDVVVRAAPTTTNAARETSIELVAAEAAEESFDASSLQAQGGTVTIVFSDIESSTEHAMRLGDSKWYELLGHHNDLVRGFVRQHGGKEIKSQGDGFMLTFPSARSAVRAMSDVQRALAREEGEDHAIRIRIGIHTGEGIADASGDLFGKHIITAARIANLADGGQILVSDITKAIAATGDFEFGAPQQVALKGIEEGATVYEVVWQGAAAKQVS